MIQTSIIIAIYRNLNYCYLHSSYLTEFYVYIGRIKARGPQLFQITSMALGITQNHCQNLRISRRFKNRNFYVSFWIFRISLYIMNLAIHKPLFGKQESQKLIQESRNQAKNLKILESRRQKFRVVDPLDQRHPCVWHEAILLVPYVPRNSTCGLADGKPWVSMPLSRLTMQICVTNLAFGIFTN